MSATPMRLAEEAEISRARFDLAIDRLGSRFTPLGILDEVVGQARRGPVAGIIDRGVAAVRRDPLPILLVAAGAGLLAWHIFASRDEDEPDRTANAFNGPTAVLHVPAGTD